MFTDYGGGVTVAYGYEDSREDWTRLSGPTFGEITRRYSGGGRLMEFTQPNGDRTQRFYDAVGSMRAEIDALGVQRNFTYDGAQRLLVAEDTSLGTVTTYTRDGAGRVLSLTDPTGAVTPTEYSEGGYVSGVDGHFDIVRRSRFPIVEICADGRIDVVKRA